MFRCWIRKCIVLSGALLASNMAAGLCIAGKPTPPPNPPGPGTISFRESAVSLAGTPLQNVWEMSSDGSISWLSHTRESTDAEEPSYLTYNGARWWLTLVDDLIYGNDLYAFQVNDTGGLTWVKLTDVACDQIDLLGDLIRARWAPGDAFITVVGADKRLTPPTYHIWRIDISGLEIEIDREFVNPVTVSDIRFEAIVNGSEPINGSYALSPDGARVVYQTPSGVWVTRVDTPNAKTFLRSAGMRFDWSPDGTKIAFTVKPSIWTMNVDGSGAKAVAVGKIVTGTMNGSPGYLHSFWSPDSKWLVFRREVQVRVGGSRPIQCDIVQMPADGGTIINLTGDMDPYRWKLPFGWRPNE
jgi:hypothetical protein